MFSLRVVLLLLSLLLVIRPWIGLLLNIVSNFIERSSLFLPLLISFKFSTTRWFFNYVLITARKYRVFTDGLQLPNSRPRTPEVFSRATTSRRFERRLTYRWKSTETRSPCPICPFWTPSTCKYDVASMIYAVVVVHGYATRFRVTEWNCFECLLRTVSTWNYSLVNDDNH